ncbi:MAG: hypothetical protein DMF88_20135 [Acidobacteria bacterium]|nr:MAG: hypothetical protein DMF88_20135 [Acidobacteriota bacterium]
MPSATKRVREEIRNESAQRLAFLLLQAFQLAEHGRRQWWCASIVSFYQLAQTIQIREGRIAAGHGPWRLAEFGVADRHFQKEWRMKE